MRRLTRRRFAVAIATSFAVLAQTHEWADVNELTKRVAGTVVHYKVVLPNGYDRTKAYPAILAFGAVRKR